MIITNNRVIVNRFHAIFYILHFVNNSAAKVCDNKTNPFPEAFMTETALLGFGTVGSGVAEVLTENRGRIAAKTGLDLSVKYILDLREFPGHPLADCVVHDFDVILRDPGVSIVAVRSNTP